MSTDDVNKNRITKETFEANYWSIKCREGEKQGPKNTKLEKERAAKRTKREN